MQVRLEELDLGGTVDEYCDGANMLTGTIPAAWAAMQQLTT
jgi:hypothetical protein